jgi:hypothetical protein
MEIDQGRPGSGPGANQAVDQAVDLVGKIGRQPGILQTCEPD